MIRTALHYARTYLRPRFGRLSPSHAVRFGEGLSKAKGAIAYLGFGPAVVLFDIPERFAKPDAPVVDVADLIPSIEELNAAFLAAMGRPGPRKSPED